MESEWIKVGPVGNWHAEYSTEGRSVGDSRRQLQLGSTRRPKAGGLRRFSRKLRLGPHSFLSS